MNFRPELVPDLRNLLRALDTSRENRDQLAAQIALAEAAAARLRDQASELDAQARKVADFTIPAAADRVSQLISGASVPLPERKAVDDAAVKTRHIGAQRQQFGEDLAAVEAHIASLKASLQVADAHIAVAEKAFLAALADAAFDAYRRDAIAFVAEHMPQLNSLARHLRARTGEGPYWEFSLLTGLRIHWYEGELKRLTPHHQPERDFVMLWPRPGNTLVSGEPVLSEALVDGLIADLRSPAWPASALADVSVEPAALEQ